MKKLFLIFIAVMVVLGKRVDYKAALTYNFDSNIAQNSSEVGKNYFVPSLGGEYKLPQTSLYLTTDFVYDFYLIERDFDDNSPFWKGGIGGDFKWKKLRYDPELLYSLYLANSVYRTDSSSEPENWVPVIQSIAFKNKFRQKVKKIDLQLNTTLSYYDYEEGDDDKEGGYLTLSPKVSLQKKVKKKDLVGLKEVAAEIKYEGAYVKKYTGSYNRWTASVGGEMKLFYPLIGCKISYGEKYFRGEEEHPHSGEMFSVKHSYITLAPHTTIDLVSDLSLKVAGKYQFKESNHPSDTYNRYVTSLLLVWNSSL